MDETRENTSPIRDKRGHYLKGHSGNPKGKPKGSISITAMIKAMLGVTPEESKVTYAESLIKSILKKAIIEGDATMQKAIWAYIDGLPKENIGITNETEDKNELRNLLANADKQTRKQFIDSYRAVVSAKGSSISVQPDNDDRGGDIQEDSEDN